MFSSDRCDTKILALWALTTNDHSLSLDFFFTFSFKECMIAKFWFSIQIFLTGKQTLQTAYVMSLSISCINIS